MYGSFAITTYPNHREALRAYHVAACQWLPHLAFVAPINLDGQILSNFCAILLDCDCIAIWMLDE